MLEPTKAGLEKTAAETKQAFVDVGKKIEAELAKSKAPGGVFAKETYVEIGQKIKQVRRRHRVVKMRVDEPRE